MVIVQLTNSDDVPVMFRRADAEKRVHSSFLVPESPQRLVPVHTVLVEAIFENHFAESFM